MSNLEKILKKSLFFFTKTESSTKNIVNETILMILYLFKKTCKRDPDPIPELLWFCTNIIHTGEYGIWQLFLLFFYIELIANSFRNKIYSYKFVVEYFVINYTLKSRLAIDYLQSFICLNNNYFHVQ